MKKLLLNTSILSLCLSIANFCFSQKNFSLTVYADSSIDTKSLYVYCNGGKGNIRPSGTFKNGKLIVKGEYFSKYADITMLYEKDSLSYSRQFWISEKPATIKLSGKQEENLFNKARTTNMIDVWKEHNALKKELDRYTINELNAMSALWQNEALLKVPSAFDSMHKKVFIALFKKASVFIKAHNTNYFYFWYFKEQLYGPSKFRNDTSLRMMVRDSLLSIFPKKVVSSFESKKILEEIENYIRPKTGILVPAFTSYDINGKPFDIKNYKGKFVLLDFWATWCPPCIKQIPFVRSLRSDFSNDFLEIVGINNDSDFKIATEFARKMNMNWTHLNDKERNVNNLFSIQAIPVLILINKDGKIVFDSRSNEGGEDELRKLLIQKNN